MNLNYQLDVDPASYSLNHTPGLAAQQLPFYVHSYGHFHALASYRTEREGLDNYLLIYTRSGRGVLHYRGGDYQIAPGQAFLIHCREYQLYRTGADGHWEIQWLHFNGPACPGYFGLINEERLRVVTPLNPLDFGGQLDQIPQLIMRNSFEADNEMAFHLTRLMTQMVKERLSPERQIFPQYQERLNQFIAYLQEHYREKLKMGELMAQIPLSKYHFIRLFKKYTGFSPYGFLVNYRIHDSKRLLQGTDLSVKEIAYQVGFNDVNNYIREFKKLVGTTPAQYRKLWL